MKYATPLLLGWLLTACAGSDGDTGIEHIVAADSCTLARPDFGGPATAEDRAVFAYNAQAPLNLKVTLDSTKNNVQFNSFSFDSPAGGSATC